MGGVTTSGASLLCSRGPSSWSHLPTLPFSSPPSLLPPGPRGTTTPGGTTLASPAVLTMTPSPTGTRTGKRRTGAACTASARPRACAAASAPTHVRWGPSSPPFMHDHTPESRPLCSQELMFPLCFVFSQSQIYRNHGVTAAPYEAPHPPGSLPGDYAYGAYGSNFGSAQGFPEYGYPAEAGWPSTEQGVCVIGALCSHRYRGMSSHTAGAASQAWGDRGSGFQLGWELVMAWSGLLCRRRTAVSHRSYHSS